MCAKNILEDRTPRRMVVMNPICLIIENLKNHIFINCPYFPTDYSRGTYRIKINKIVYIDSCDFQMETKKNYYGLSPGRTVRLKYAFNIKYVSHKLGKDGKIINVNVRYDPTSLNNPKQIKRGHLTWVCDPIISELRKYNQLFNTENPNPDNYLKELNLASEIIDRAYISSSIINDKSNVFQFEHLGYFIKDKESTKTYFIFNQTCSLKLQYK